MEVYDGFRVDNIDGSYSTVVREFDETRGLWEEVVYKTVNGIEYVEARRDLSMSAVKKPSNSPNDEFTPPKPKKVNKPVLQMEKPKKPEPFLPTLTPKGINEFTPGPIGEVANSPALDNTTRESKSKYLYSYGIKNIGIEHRTYEDRGIFVSKPMVMEGNVVEVSLLATEEHPLFDGLSGKATDRMTSIEYYISYEENPSLDDWHPILPEGQEEIKSEKLFFTNTTATLRFHARLDQDEKTNVYKNGLKLDKNKWALLERGPELQLLEERDLTAIYTIDYVPEAVVHSPWKINVKEKGAKRVRQIDRFKDGTAYNKTVTLSKYPYVDYAYINGKQSFDANVDAYKPFEVYLREAKIAVGDGKNVDTVLPIKVDKDPYTWNVTDYKDGKDVRLTPYSIVPGKEYKAFEYKQERNKLIFSETFNRADIHTNEDVAHGNAEIEVHYEYLVAQFRLKIILRKNTGNEIIMSPRVNDYQVKFKIMK